MNNFTVNFTSVSQSSQSSVLTSLRDGAQAVNFLFGFPTHSYIFWLIVTGKGNRIASEFFNLNLSVCEIVNCVNSLFAVIFHIFMFSSIRGFLYFLIGLAITGRPVFQCLMCVERYLAVVHPVTFLKYKPLRYRVICCAVAWVITIGSCLCCMFILLLFPIFAYVFINSIQFILFFSIQLFCLMAVLRALKQSGPGERKKEKEENHMKRKAFHIILITTVSMTITYVPYALSALFYILTHNYDGPVAVGVICFILAGFIQPALYLHSYGKLLCSCLFHIKKNSV